MRGMGLRGIDAPHCIHIVMRRKGNIRFKCCIRPVEIIPESKGICKPVPGDIIAFCPGAYHHAALVKFHKRLIDIPNHR